MVIFNSTVDEFFKLCETPRQLVSVIQKNLLYKFGIKVGEAEKRSWFNSLPDVRAVILINKPDARIVLIEYNIPLTRNRIDFVILGKNKNNQPSAWILELKQWSSITEEDWNLFRIGRYTSSHPAQQALNYQNLLNNILGLKNKVEINSSVFLPNFNNVKDSVLFDKKYDIFNNKINIYDHNAWVLKTLIADHTKYKDDLQTAFNFFKTAKWSPTQNFLEIVYKDLNNINLAGSQQKIYDDIAHFIKYWNKQDKVTYLISGDPGSGKTIIGFKLLNLLVVNLKLKIQMMIPGLELRSAFKQKLNDKALVNFISGSTLWKRYDAAIIDEGHKAIGRNIGYINYEKNYKNLKFAIILIDDNQVINKKGVTKSQIKTIAKSQNHKIYELNIEENFRHLGERQILDWIDHVFYQKINNDNNFNYEQVKYINDSQNYKVWIYDNSKKFTDKYFEMFEKQNDKNSVRITSLWSESFYLGDPDKNGFPKPTVFIGNTGFIWNPNKEWANQLKKINNKLLSKYNKITKKFANNSESFLTSKPYKNFIAYFNHIQGYEFDHIFVFIPKKIFTYSNNEIIFHREGLAEEVQKSQTWSYNINKKSKINTYEKAYKLNKQYFLNRLKVMITRGKKSTHIFAEDKQFNDYLKSKIKI